MTDKLPKESESQEIGRQAGKVFEIKAPDDWLPEDLSGNTDFGIDYLIQLKNKSREIAYPFYLQLKGTHHPQYTKHSEAIKHAFKVTTLNYYRQIYQLVMVAVVDLTNYANERSQCSVFYKWLLKEELDSLLSDKQHQETVTIHVPVVNRIEPTLDIWSYCAEKILEENATHALIQSVKSYSKSPSRSLFEIANAIQKKPSFLDAAGDDDESPWVNNSENIVSGKLQKSFEHIKSNNIQAAAVVLKDLQKPGVAKTRHETAELFCQLGQIDLLQGRDDDAQANFKIAFETHPLSKYKLAYFESQFSLDGSPSTKQLKEMEKSLSEASYKECIVKAKCLAIRGCRKKSIGILKKNHPQKFIGLLLVGTLLNDHAVIDEAISNIDIGSLKNDREKYVYLSLKSRKLFRAAIGDSADSNERIPPHGKESFDLSKIRETYICLEEAWAYAKRLGYPSDVILLLDTSAIVYPILFQDERLEASLNELLSERNHNQHILTTLAAVSFNKSQYKKALNAINHIPLPIPIQEREMKILCYYHLDNYPEVLKLFDSQRDELRKQHTDRYSHLLVVCAQSARELFDKHKEAEYLDELKVVDQSKLLTPIYNYVTESKDNPKLREQLNGRLYKEYIDLGRPKIIAEQLSPHLDAHAPTDAAIIIELSGVIADERSLFPDEVAHLAQAYITCSDWPKLYALSSKRIEQGSKDSQWHLLKAYSLERLGNIGAAKEVLSSDAFLENLSDQSTEYFARFNLKFGTLDVAEEKLVLLFSKTSDRAKKCSILFALLHTYTFDGVKSDKLAETFSRLSTLVDKEDVDEEGAFLQCFLTLPKEANIPEALVSECRTRLLAYSERFPDSKMLRMFQATSDARQPAFVEELKRAAGITAELESKWKTNRNLIRRGQLPAPFEMLGCFLREFRDIYSAWRFANVTPDENIEYKLVHAATNEGHIIDQVKSGKKLVLDITSILILNELDLLDKFIEHAPSIYIKKSTYEELIRSAHRVSGSFYFDSPRAILSILKKRLDKVFLLDAPRENAITDYQNLLKPDEHFLVCDDRNLAALLKKPDNEVGQYNFFNVLYFLFSMESISEEEYFRQFSRFFSLGIIAPNLQFLLIAQYIKYISVSNPKLSLMSTGLASVFNKVFAIGMPFKEALRVFYGMYLALFIDLKFWISPSNFVESCKHFLLRNTKISQPELIARVFLLLSNCTAVERNQITEISHIHQKYWNFYIESLALVDPRNCSDERAIDLALATLFKAHPNEFQDVFHAIISGLAPQTHDNEYLQEKYLKYVVSMNSTNNINGM